MRIILLFSLLAVFAVPALAYVDPGTGSLMFQLLIAGIAGAIFSIKLFWKKIKAFFTRLFPGCGGTAN